jgi:hypothetical protein
MMMITAVANDNDDEEPTILYYLLECGCRNVGRGAAGWSGGKDCTPASASNTMTIYCYFYTDRV